MPAAPIADDDQARLAALACDHPVETPPDDPTWFGALARQAAHQLALQRRGPTERRLAQAFVLTLALLLSILGFCFWQANHFLASDWWMTHTNQVIRNIEGILSEVQTAESSQRGFSATGKEEFLAPYRQAMDGLPARLEDLRRLLGDDASQGRRCRELAGLLAAKHRAMSEYIDARRTLGLAALDPSRATGRGRRTMAELLAKGHEMIEAENLLWRQRDTARTHHLHVAAGMLLGTGALCVTLLTAGFVVSRRELRRRQALGGSLAQANAGLSAEVAERRRAQASLRESEARFQRIANNVPGMVYRLVQRPDGGVAFSFVSEGSRKIFGLEPAQIQGDARLVLGTVHPEDKEDFRRTRQVSAATVGPWSWQGRIQRPDTGEIRFVEGSSQPERQPDGEIVWDGVLVDATERRQADEHRRAKEDAERISQEKSRFLSRVSHELRTPLNAILGFGQLLELSALAERDAESLDYMLKGARHLLSLVNEVLELSCSETGELPLAPGRVNAEEVARECVGLLSQEAQARNVSCQVQNQAPPGNLWCDEHRLRQVLLNLLSNAIQYNHRGGNVVISCERARAGRLRLRVADTGSGISPEGMQKLFLPFERLEHADPKAEGTGLGLAVSRRMAEAMGGTMGAESKAGQGSVFWIELPLAEESAPLPTPPAENNGGPVRIASSPSAAKLLYIEDNTSNLQAVERLLGRLRPQWQFLAADDGLSGLELARQTHPDVILLDRHMPGLSGEEVLAELRREPGTEHTPVIVLSADATAESSRFLLAQGADDYITKPFQIEGLLAAVDRALTHKAA